MSYNFAPKIFAYLEAWEALCCVFEHETLIICLVLVQTWKTGKHPDMIEKLLTGMLSINTIKPSKSWGTMGIYNWYHICPKNV